MTATISIDEAQLRLRDLIHRLLPGDEICIIENQRPVARLVSEPTSPQIVHRPPPGVGRDMISFIADDFDAPLECMKEYLE